MMGTLFSAQNRWFGLVFLAAFSLLILQTATAERSIPPASPTKPPVSAQAHNATQLNAQGGVQLDVILPNAVQAGQLITYTYAYSNTGSSLSENLLIKATWADFQVNQGGSDKQQFCADKTGPCRALVVEGPDAVKIEPDDPNAPALCKPVTGQAFFCYQVGKLKAGESGKFKVILRVETNTYPKSGEKLKTPSGSGQLFVGSATTPTSEDTANAMVVGPVFDLNKEVSSSTKKVYPGENVDFKLQVGNAIGSSNTLNDGQVRGDAIAATNIVVEDYYPEGSTFVSATGSYELDGTKKLVRWKISRLEPGKDTFLSVRFQKDPKDNKSCTSLANTKLTVTSEQMPFDEKDLTKRLTISGKSASADVTTPLKFNSIASSPSSIPFGSEGWVNISLNNYWNKATPDVKLEFNLQTNLTYLEAKPAPSSAPIEAVGGKVVWTFALTEATMLKPNLLNFRVKVRAGLSNDITVAPKTSSAKLILPTTIPSACVEANFATAGQTPLRLFSRLAFKKDAGVDPKTITGDFYNSSKGQNFPYFIEITNNDLSEVKGISITDTLPTSPTQKGAKFSYVAGSSFLTGTLNSSDQSLEPTKIYSDAQKNQVLRWDNVTVPASSSVRLRYALRVDGLEYQRYTNKADVKFGKELLEKKKDSVVVKINPLLSVSKSVDKTEVKPGEAVEFTLRMTNTEQTTLKVGLYDVLGDFIFGNVIRGGEPTKITGKTNDWGWPISSLGKNESVTAVFTATVPNECKVSSKQYVNNAKFWIESETEPGKPYPVDILNKPPTVSVLVKCTPSATPTPVATPLELSFTKSPDRKEVSLYDRVVYSVQLTNNSKSTFVKDVTVKDTLPPGFTFEKLDKTLPLTLTPELTKEGERQKLTWQLAGVKPGATTIKYTARSANVVNSYTSALTVTTSDSTAKIKKNAEWESIASVTVKPLSTISSEIMSATLSEKCARPGDNFTSRLTFLNTNNHSYLTTTVILTIPIGLKYVSPANPTLYPKLLKTGDGLSQLLWEDLMIPAKPANSLAAQKRLEVQLAFDRVWKDVKTGVLVTSPDGLIPAKDSISDALVPACLQTNPSASLIVDRQTASIGDDIIYTITIHNPTGDATTLTIDDVLPDNVDFNGMINGRDPDEKADDKLKWKLLRVEGQSDETLVFKAKVVSGSTGSDISNSIKVTSPTPFFTDNGDLTKNTIKIGDTKNVLLKAGFSSNAKCANSGEEKSYLIQVRNPNTYATNVTVTLQLPFGLDFMGIDATANTFPGAPLLATTKDGQIRLRWQNLTLPAAAKTDGISLETKLKLRVGAVLQDLQTMISGTNQVGLLSPLHTEEDLTLPVCLSQGSNVVAAYTVVPTEAKAGEKVVYQVAVNNPTTSDLTLNLESQLPTGFAFAETLAGATPSLSGTTLSWADLKLAAGKTLELRFTATVKGDTGKSYTSQAKVLNSSGNVEFKNNSTAVKVLQAANVVYQVYLPIVKR